MAMASSRPTWRSPTARWSSRSRRRTSNASPRSSRPSAPPNAPSPSPRPVPDPAAPVLGPDRLGRFSVDRTGFASWSTGRSTPSSPRFGWLHGIDYVFADESETASLDQRRLFLPAYRVLDPGLSSALGVEPGKPVLYHPRAAFDLWGARYFILPSSPGDWTDDNRSYAAFIDGTDLIYPDPASLAGPGHAGDRRRWLQDRDVQIRRNRSAFPRAWVVHDARLIRPLDRDHSASLDALIARLRSADAAGRAEASSSAVDLRRTAYVETDASVSPGPLSAGR